MTKKMTKKEKFALIAETIATVEVENKAEMLDFINHEIELLNKKSGKSGQTKTQKENELLKENLLNAFESMDRPVTISEFQEKSAAPIASLSNQKLSALLNQLVKAEKMVKTVEKKRSYFALA
jgi:hypothetical protein